MGNFKLCPNGHYYQEDLPECPYCPSSSKDSKKYDTGTGADLSKTQIVSDDIIDESKESSLLKTQVFNSEIEETKAESKPDTTKTGRKLVGWLVSFTVDSLGKDFKLYEGRNTIGNGLDSNICIDDSAMSSHHLTILYRMGAFKFKDELSTNGTFVNKEIIDEGNLKDGDIIKLGNTIFKFRTV